MWLGVFFVAQGLVSPFALSFSKDFKTLPPNMDTKLEVLGPGTPGIEGLQHITTDGKGFRAYPPVDYQAKRGLRIVAIGGSTTENGLLDDQQIWPYLLQEELKSRLERPVEVINTGVSGTRAVHHLATLRHVLEYEPDIVLFLVGANDWNKHIREHYGSSYYREHKYLFRDTILGHIADLLLETGRAASADGEAIERFNGDYYTQQNNSLGRPDQRSFRPSEVANDYRATLHEISAVCKESGVECVFVTQPNGYAVDASDDYTASFWMTPTNESYTLTLDSMAWISDLYNGYLLAFAKDNDHLAIDLAAQIRPSHDHLYDDVHFNRAGSRHVALVLAQELSRHVVDDEWSHTADAGDLSR